VKNTLSQWKLWGRKTSFQDITSDMTYHHPQLGLCLSNLPLSFNTLGLQFEHIDSMFEHTCLLVLHTWVWVWQGVVLNTLFQRVSTPIHLWVWRGMCVNTLFCLECVDHLPLRVSTSLSLIFSEMMCVLFCKKGIHTPTL